MSRWTFGACLVALLGAIAVCWNAVIDPRQTMLCGWIHPDCMGNHWLMVWVAEQVASGHTLLHNDRYYWPMGDSPWLAGNGNEGFPYLIWHELLGWPLGSTVHLVLVLALNGMSAYALCRAAGTSRAAAFAAVPAATIMIYTVQELGAGRFSQVSVCWLGFFLASWLRFLDSPTRRTALIAALMLALTAFFYWYYGFFGVLAGVILWLGKRTPLRPLLEFCAAFLVIIGPLLLVFATHQSLIPGVSEVFPNPETPGDSCFPAIPFLAQKGRHAGRILAVTTTLFGLAGLVMKRDRTTVQWIAVWVVFAGLMAGPLIPHGPYEQLYGLASPLRRFWWPYRHVILLNFAVILVAARGMDALLGRWPWAIALLGLTVPLQLEFQAAPWRAITSKAALPTTFYRAVRDMPGTILVEPPLAPGIASSQAPLLYQLDHRKILLGGHALWVDRVRPDGWDAAIAKNSFLYAMQQLELGKLTDSVFRFKAEDLQSLMDSGATTFVINYEFFPSALQALPRVYVNLFEDLFGAPVVKAKRAYAFDGANWTGVTEVPFEPWTWPEGLKPGGPNLAIQVPRYPSMAFAMGEMPPPPPAGSGPQKGAPPGPAPAPGTGR